MRIGYHTVGSSDPSQSENSLRNSSHETSKSRDFGNNTGSKDSSKNSTANTRIRNNDQLYIGGQWDHVQEKRHNLRTIAGLHNL